MRFGAILEAYAIPEWSEKYLAYTKLKKILKQKRAQIEKEQRKGTLRHLQIFEQFRDSLGKLRDIPVPKSDRSDGVASTDNIEPFAHPNTSSRSTDGNETVDVEVPANEDNSAIAQTTMPSKTTAAHLDFMKSLWNEMDKVEDHFTSTKSEILERLSGVEDELHALETTYYQPNQERSIAAHKARLQRCVVWLSDLFEKLEGYVKLNMMASYKILKKKDKILGIDENVGGILKHLPKCKEKFALLTIDAKIHEYVMKVYKKCLSEKDHHEIGEIAFVNARRLVSSQVKGGSTTYRSGLGFASGICIVLLLDIVVLSVIPPTNPLFSLERVMVSFPIFRLLLMPIILLWFMGIAIYFFEEYGVNYKFLLGIDPKCEVISSTLYSIAAWQTLVWVLFFGCFLVHHKFFPITRSDDYYFDWCCIGALVVVQGILWISPHRRFRHRYRKSLLRTVWVTIVSGVQPPRDVTLAMNVLGDFFTSFSKPLADVGYLLCYVWWSLRLGMPPTSCISCLGFTSWLIPLLMAFPFWLRFLHCYVRLRKEPSLDEGGKGYVHAANMAKYLLSLAIIGVTAVPWNSNPSSLYRSRFLWIFAYISATAYSFIWDIYMDWGLFPDPDAFIRPHQKTMFPSWMYLGIAFLNLLGRLTWALTLMPFNFIYDAQIFAELLILFISVTEIIRRCAWIILRLENEHLTNQSRYRAMLWIPRMVDESASHTRQDVSVPPDFALMRNVSRPFSSRKDMSPQTPVK